MTKPAEGKGKAPDPHVEREADADNPEQRVRRARQAVTTTEAAIQSAKIDLETARFEERDYWEEKEPGSTERGRHEEIKATWSFWKGSDWTAEEKRNLAKAQAALLLGIGGLGTLVSSGYTFVSARDGLKAADARVEADDTAVNRGLADSARSTLAAAATGISNSSYTYFAVIVAAALVYYDVCAKHAENVKDLNAPEVTKRRDRLERWLAELERRLAAEQRAVDEAVAARRQAQKAEKKSK